MGQLVGWVFLVGAAGLFRGHLGELSLHLADDPTHGDAEDPLTTGEQTNRPSSLLGPAEIRTPRSSATASGALRRASRSGPATWPGIGLTASRVIPRP